MPAWRSHWSSARTGQVHSASGVLSGLAAAGDLDFPSLPLLVGLRPRKRDGDAPGAGLEVFEPDAGQFGPPQASREPDQDLGPIPGGGQGTPLLDIQHPPDQSRVTAALPSCFVPVVLRMPA
jgi:hypothetical protein